MEKKHIVLNLIRCLGCKQVLLSLHRHDFRMCSCSLSTFNDGGTAYLRRGSHDPSKIEELSIVLVNGLLYKYDDIPDIIDAEVQNATGTNDSSS